ncbi:hypothetical protein PC111_g16852 [Phytophthora cactorum]|nr:hypothetical protein PC111_g16852 [Phytophthora cactorum]KAG3059696.1 hypothetical protein PC122_g20218 [Phytophthora cactorum]
MVYDMDFVHSAIFAKDAALVDQQINDGASFNPDLVYGQGRVGVLVRHQPSLASCATLSGGVC